MKTNVQLIIASVAKLHGDTRDQASKHSDFIAWQLRQRAIARGDEPSNVIKQCVDDPCDGFGA